MYNYAYWGAQITQFIEQVVGGPVFLVANSIGCVAAMQVATDNPDLVRGIVQFDPSLRLLTVQRRNWFDNITAPLIMRALVEVNVGPFESYSGRQDARRNDWKRSKLTAYLLNRFRSQTRSLAQFFFTNLSSPKTLKSVLGLAYHDKAKIDDDLINALRAPAMLPRALDVFLAFITYDTGPIPEDFLPILKMPVRICSKTPRSTFVEKQKAKESCWTICEQICKQHCSYATILLFWGSGT